jgi:hypothetical protein
LEATPPPTLENTDIADMYMPGYMGFELHFLEFKRR